MARFEFSGIDNYISQLNKLQQSTKDGVVGRTVYAGAAVVADSCGARYRLCPWATAALRAAAWLTPSPCRRRRGFWTGLALVK